MHLERAGRNRALDADENRQVFELDIIDQVGGIARLCLRLGNDNGDFLARKAPRGRAPEPDGTAPEWAARRGLSGGWIGGRLAEAGIGDILAGQHSQ